MTEPSVVRRDPRSVMLTNSLCAPLREMYARVLESAPTSWNQVEQQFLAAITQFDAGLPRAFPADVDEKEASRELSAAIQNGKGDWFNNVLATLLENCSAIETLYVRRSVPGLIVPEHNLDGVYPGDPTREIEFLLEAKMMGTPKHANSRSEKSAGRPGSKDTGKRVKELAFKSIDLKGEASRRLTMRGQAPGGGGAGGGDLSTWLHAHRPRIYFFLAVRVVSESDLAAVQRWAATAAQVVDAVGLFCYRDGDSDSYVRVDGIPTEYAIDRVLYRACIELQALRTDTPVAATDVDPTRPFEP